VLTSSNAKSKRHGRNNRSVLMTMRCFPDAYVCREKTCTMVKGALACFAWGAFPFFHSRTRITDRACQRVGELPETSHGST
jgi:hypothetical protein